MRAERFFHLCDLGGLGGEIMMKKEGLMFVVSGPSGSGKTTLCRAMLQIFPHLHFSVSYTTRPKRAGDVNGKDYYFVSAEEFRKMIQGNTFAEWAEIYGQRYGTSKMILEKVREQGRDVILDIDGQGARQLRDKNLRGVFIFILPPSWAELKQRLASRKTEEEAALEERLRKARAEMAEARWYDYIIINDVLEKAQERLEAVIRAEHCRREGMVEAWEDLLLEK